MLNSLDVVYLLAVDLDRAEHRQPFGI